MTDRKRCRRCRYYTRNDDVCNFMLDTGMKRQHDGDICYSYERARSSREDEGIVKDRHQRWVQGIDDYD